MNSRELTSDAIIGVVIGFALSGLFYVIWGAFQLVGFFLWSIAAGGGGAVLGRVIVRARWGAVLGAVVVRLAIFVFFGGFIFPAG